MKTTRLIRKIHKLTAAVVGIQLLLWVVSGLYMTAVPIDIVRGNHLVQSQPQEALNADGIKTPAEIMATVDGVKKLELATIRGKAVYLISSANGRQHIDAISGEKLNPISEVEAKQIAADVYLGNGEIVSINWIDAANKPQELSGRAVPAWQVVYDDTFQNTLYISANTGQVSSVRSDIWRIFDFLWMLHIMDYEDRSDINNPLVIFMVSLSTLLVLSGLLMLINAINKNRWRFYK